MSGHVLRGSGGDSHLLVLEGTINGKRRKGRPRLTWMDNIMRWINVGSYAEARKWAGVRDSWRTMVVNLFFEDDKWMNEWIKFITYFCNINNEDNFLIIPSISMLNWPTLVACKKNSYITENFEYAKFIGASLNYKTYDSVFLSF